MKNIVKTCKFIQIMTIAIGVLSVFFTILYWHKIPEKVPTHFAISGKADSWGGKGIIIVILLLSLVLLGLMFFAAYTVKGKSGKEKEDYPYSYLLVVWLNFGTELFFAYIVYICASGKEKIDGWMMWLLLALIFVPVVCGVVARFCKGKRKKERDFFCKDENECGQIWRSRVDLWFILLLVGCMGIMIYQLIVELLAGKAAYPLVIGLLVLAGIIVPLFKIKYVFCEEYLKVDCSLFGKERISYESIISMKKTMNPLSSAALSLRRIEIHYEVSGRREMILVSPKDRDAFIQEVEKRQNERGNR